MPGRHANVALQWHAGRRQVVLRLALNPLEPFVPAQAAGKPLLLEEFGVWGGDKAERGRLYNQVHEAVTEARQGSNRQGAAASGGQEQGRVHGGRRGRCKLVPCCTLHILQVGLASGASTGSSGASLQHVPLPQPRPAHPAPPPRSPCRCRTRKPAGRSRAACSGPGTPPARRPLPKSATAPAACLVRAESHGGGCGARSGHGCAAAALLTAVDGWAVVGDGGEGTMPACRPCHCSTCPCSRYPFCLDPLL